MFSRSATNQNSNTVVAAPPDSRFSLPYLRQLHEQLVKNKLVTSDNEKLVIEILRIIAEMVVYGDNKSELLFDFFCEKNMLYLFLEIMWGEVGCANTVHVQILQTLSILVSCVKNNTSLYYLLSNNYINEIIVYPHDFDSDENLCSQFVSFMKSLSLRLNNETVQFFFIEETGTFPLLSRAIDLLNSNENMARIAAQTTILNILKVKDARARSYALQDELMVKLFTVVMSLMEKQYQGVLDACREHVMMLHHARHGQGEESAVWALLERRLPEMLTAVEDWLYYIQDIFELKIMFLRRALVHHLMNELVYPLFLKPFLHFSSSETTDNSDEQMSPIRKLLRLSDPDRNAVTEGLLSKQTLDNENANAADPSEADSSEEQIVIKTIMVQLFVTQFLRIVTDKMMHRGIITALLHPLNRKSRLRVLETLRRTQGSGMSASLESGASAASEPTLNSTNNTHPVPSDTIGDMATGSSPHRVHHGGSFGGPSNSNEVGMLADSAELQRAISTMQLEGNPYRDGFLTMFEEGSDGKYAQFGVHCLDVIIGKVLSSCSEYVPLHVLKSNPAFLHPIVICAKTMQCFNLWSYGSAGLETINRQKQPQAPSHERYASGESATSSIGSKHGAKAEGTGTSGGPGSVDANETVSEGGLISPPVSSMYSNSTAYQAHQQTSVSMKSVGSTERSDADSKVWMSAHSGDDGNGDGEWVESEEPDDLDLVNGTETTLDSFQLSCDENIIPIHILEMMRIFIDRVRERRTVQASQSTTGNVRAASIDSTEDTSNDTPTLMSPGSKMAIDTAPAVDENSGVFKFTVKSKSVLEVLQNILANPAAHTNITYQESVHVMHSIARIRLQWRQLVFTPEFASGRSDGVAQSSREHTLSESEVTLTIADGTEKNTTEKDEQEFEDALSDPIVPFSAENRRESTGMMQVDGTDDWRRKSLSAIRKMSSEDVPDAMITIDAKDEKPSLDISLGHEIETSFNDILFHVVNAAKTVAKAIVFHASMTDEINDDILINWVQEELGRLHKRKWTSVNLNMARDILCYIKVFDDCLFDPTTRFDEEDRLPSSSVEGVRREIQGFLLVRSLYKQLVSLAAIPNAGSGAETVSTSPDAVFSAGFDNVMDNFTDTGIVPTKFMRGESFDMRGKKFLDTYVIAPAFRALSPTPAWRASGEPVSESRVTTFANSILGFLGGYGNNNDSPSSSRGSRGSGSGDGSKFSPKLISGSTTPSSGRAAKPNKRGSKGDVANGGDDKKSGKYGDILLVQDAECLVFTEPNQGDFRVWLSAPMHHAEVKLENPQERIMALYVRSFEPIPQMVQLSLPANANGLSSRHSFGSLAHEAPSIKSGGANINERYIVPLTTRLLKPRAKSCVQKLTIKLDLESSYNLAANHITTRRKIMRAYRLAVLKGIFDSWIAADIKENFTASDKSLTLDVVEEKFPTFVEFNSKQSA